MDPFASLFAHTTPAARTFFAGKLYTDVEFGPEGHLHLIQRGSLMLSRSGADDLLITEPSLLLFPRGRAHGFVCDTIEGADLVCATVDLGHSMGNPIGQGLPEFVLLPLAEIPTLAPVCELLIAEAFQAEGGRQTALDRLLDYLLILIVRAVVAKGDIATGVLAGLAEPRLSRSLTAMHEQPGHPWTLDLLAEEAGMSRTRFAAHFRAVVGQTPIVYLTEWRMTLARRQLATGRPVKLVAAAMGYDSSAAFARVFGRVVGQPPRNFAPRARN